MTPLTDGFLCSPTAARTYKSGPMSTRWPDRCRDPGPRQTLWPSGAYGRKHKTAAIVIRRYEVLHRKCSRTKRTGFSAIVYRSYGIPRSVRHSWRAEGFEIRRSPKYIIRLLFYSNGYADVRYTCASPPLPKGM